MHVVFQIQNKNVSLFSLVHCQNLYAVIVIDDANYNCHLLCYSYLLHVLQQQIDAW